MIETNPAGFFHVSQSAVAQMRAQKSGQVVNITASIATQPAAGLPAALCSLTKGGLESVARALAIEYAGDGIRFKCDTPRGRQDSDALPVGMTIRADLARSGAHGEVDEVTELVLYLEWAQFINGEIVHLDAGGACR